MKYLSGFLAFLLTLSVFLNTGVVDAIAASYDVTGPTINSVTVDKTEAHPGDSVLIQVDATDEDSGISTAPGPSSDRAVIVKRVNGDQEQTVYLSYNEASGKYEGTYTVPENAVYGEYFISFISFYDAVGNKTLIGPEVGSNLYCTFSVSAGNGDVTPPTVNSVSVDKKEVQPGEDVLIQVDATDDESGVSTAPGPSSDRAVIVKRVNGDQEQTVYLSYNEASGKYEGTYTVPENAVYGEYFISFISFYDAVGNKTLIGPEVGSNLYCTFSVSAGNGDVTSPTVNSVSVDKKEVQPGEDVLIQVDATDDESGVSTAPGPSSDRAVIVKRVNGDQDRIVYLSYNEASGKYEGTYTVPENTVYGEYFISFISFYDAVGNKTLIGPEVGSNLYCTFSVIDPSKPPTVTGVKDEGFYNEPVTISFDKGKGTLNGESFKSGTSVSEEGEYVLLVKDVAGNETTVKFTIDKTAPTVTGVKNEGFYKEEVTITFNEGTATLNGENFKSGTKVSKEGSYQLEVTDATGNKTKVSFTIDKTVPVIKGIEDQGLYNKDVQITFSEGTATLNGEAFASGATVSDNGTYELVVKDTAGNSTTVSFTIDKTAPVVQGVKDKAYYNNDVKITFEEGTATLNGDEFKSGSTVSEEGSYKLVVKDAAGNLTTVSFTVDKTAPVVKGVEDQGLYNNDVQITFDEGTAILNDGAKLESGSTISDDGNYKLVVKDAAGNSTTVTFTIDKVAPAVQGVKDQAYYNEDVKITFEEGKATLNGDEFKSGSTVSEEGSHKLVVKDAAGNATTISFTIDKTAPVVQGVKDEAYYNKDVKITFEEGKATLNGNEFKSGTTVSNEGSYKLVVKDTAGNATTVSFTIDKAAPAVQGVKDQAYYNEDVKITFEEGTATLNGDEFKSGTTVSKEGSYKLVVKDAAGNSTTVSFTIDKIAPAMQGVKDQAYYNKDVKITFDEGTATLNGNEFKSGSIVSEEGAYKLVVKDVAGNSTTVSFTIDKAAPAVQGVKDEAYYNKGVKITFEEGKATLNGEAFTSGTTVSEEGSYKLVVKDAAGNTTTVSFAIDKTAPAVQGVKDQAYYNKDVKIAFDEGTATLNGNEFKSGATVSEEGAYKLVVKDAAGNSTTVSFTIDKTAPVIKGVEDQGLYNKGVQIGFNEGTAILNDDSTLESGSTISDDGNYKLVVKDTAGNATTVSFTIDKTAPVVQGVKDQAYYNKVVKITFEEGTATLNGDEFKSGATVGAEGSYKLLVKDTAGNSTTVSFTIDKTAPAVQGVKDKAYYNKDVKITFEEGTATLNGEAFASGTTVSGNGMYELVVKDTAGNSTTISFTIDKKAPVVGGVSHNKYYNKDVVVTFNEGNATLNGKTFTSGSKVSVNGKYTLVVTDKAGNKTTIVFTIDKTAPKVTGVSHNKYYNQNLTIKFNEGTAKLNNATFKSGTKVSKAGKHTLVVTDNAGNKTTVVFTIDKTAPKVTGVSHNKYYNKNVTIKFNEGTAKLNNATFKSGTKVSKAGKHTLVVTDKAGNKTTVVFTIDKTAPKVTGVSHNKYYNKNVTIKFNEGTAKLNKANFKSGAKVSKAGKHTLVVTDKAGNKTTIVFTIDKKAPSKPKVKTVTSKTKTVTGTAEKGAKIYIYKGKTKLGEGTVNSKGNYSVKIKAQKKKVKLTVYAKDKAGNKSATATVTVK